MNEFPFRISSILAYSVALTTFVVAFIGARYAFHWIRRREQKNS